MSRRMDKYRVELSEFVTHRRPARELLAHGDMKRIVDALELLTAQHETISAELAVLPTVDASRFANVLGELADQITTHLVIEEQFLTMLGISIPVFEHEGLRLAVAELLAVEMTSPALRDRIDTLTARWSAHAAPQDEAIFISLAEIVTPKLLEEIGAQLGTWSEQSRCLAA